MCVRSTVLFERDNLRSSLQGILHNVMGNQFILGETIDKPSTPPYQDLLKKAETLIATESPVAWYAWKNKILIKIIIQSNSEGDFIIVQPVEPVKIKVGFNSNSNSLDLSFYIQCCLELSQHLIIYEIKTNEL